MTSAGPLFAKRRRKLAPVEKIPAPKESELHFAVAKLLKDFARPDWIWMHVPNGELRDERTAAKLTRMGILPGVSDFLMISPGGRTHALELKRAGGKLSEAQITFRDKCMTSGIPHAVVFDLDGALEVLSNWGALRLVINSRGVPALGEGA